MCALGVELEALNFFKPIERPVQIHHKRAGIGPTDKRKDIWIVTLTGATGLYLTNKVVRAEPAVEMASGHAGCALPATGSFACIAPLVAMTWVHKL